MKTALIRSLIAFAAISFSLLFLSADGVVNTPTLPAEKDVPQVLPNENQVLAAAAADMYRIPYYERYKYRYVWATSGETDDAQAVAGINGWLSRGTTAVRPEPFGARKLILQRVDLTTLAPRTEDFEEFAATWEELRFDPRFNVLLTKATLKFLVGFELPKGRRTVTKQRDVKITVPAYVHTDGKTYTGKWVKESYDEIIEVDPFDGTDVVRIVRPDLDFQSLSFLIQSTGSQAPVVNLPYFAYRALSTIDGNDGVYKTIWGGLYYRFRGIKSGFKKGSDLDNLLAGFGIGNVAAGVTAENVFDQQRSDGRVAVFESIVTKRPRRVDNFRTLNGHINFNSSFGSITHDLNRDGVDVDKNPIMNLLNKFNQFDASELIVEGTTGFHLFAIFDGQGNLLNQVGDNVATDYTVPSGFLANLQPAISCIRCHGPFGGWQPLTNDVWDDKQDEKLLGPRNYLNVFDDLAFTYEQRKRALAKKLSSKFGIHFREDTLDRLVGLYQGDPELQTLARARNDYSVAIRKTTGNWRSSEKKTQADAAKQLSAKVSDIYAKYWYSSVGPEDVLRDLGYPAQKNAKDAGEFLQKQVPPFTQQFVVDHDVAFIPEDPRIGALFRGQRIPRTDYDLIYGPMAARVAFAKAAKFPVNGNN